MMKEIMEYIKRIVVYAAIIWKRMWKTRGYVLVFLLVPLVLISISQVSGEETEVKVAVYMEGMPELMERLTAKGGTVQFSFYESEEEVKREVAIAKAECGLIIPEDLFESLQENRFKNSIVCFVSPQTSMQTICKEAFFAELFSLFEEYTFPEQAAEMISTELGETENEEFAKRAEDLLKQYRYNGSTFQFEHEDYKSNAAQSAANLSKDKKEEAGLLSVRGICALMIFICALCGTMDALEDENAKRICRLKQNKMFLVLTIYVPVFVMSVIALFCYAVTGITEGIGKEIGAMLLYQVLLLVYSIVLKKLCRREENLATVMAILSLMTAVVCPVFVDLSQFIPALKILGKMFPVYHYLDMF